MQNLNSISKHSLIIACFGLAIIQMSCKEEQVLEDYELVTRSEYFPVNLGQMHVYQVDSVEYDEAVSGTITFVSTTFVRERLIDTFSDLENRMSYKLERAERKSETDPWKVTDIWVLTKTDKRVERVEENLRYIKMVFPFDQGTVWDGHSLMDDEVTIEIRGEELELFKSWDDYYVESIEAKSVLGIEYNDVAKIVHAASENVIELRESTEYYAPNIGLIEKRMRILDTQNTDTAFSFEDRAEKGFILRQKLISFTP